jgi:hypothetical protein
MQWMLPAGMERIVGRITAGAIGINLVAAAVLAPTRGPVGMAWSILMAEICKVLALATVLFRVEGSPESPESPGNGLARI